MFEMITKNTAHVQNAPLFVRKFLPRGSLSNLQGDCAWLFCPGVLTGVSQHKGSLLLGYCQMIRLKRKLCRGKLCLPVTSKERSKEVQFLKRNGLLEKKFARAFIARVKGVPST